MKRTSLYIALLVFGINLAQAQVASPKALSTDFYQELLTAIQNYGFTLQSPADVQAYFVEFTKDPNARMENAGGLCATRERYIRGKLEERGISSGKFYVRCNYKKGELRLTDRVKNRPMTFVNYHVANAVLVNGQNGPEIQILDLQFEDAPVSLSQYIGEIEQNQKLLPETGKTNLFNNRSPKYCYWKIEGDKFSSAELY